MKQVTGPTWGSWEGLTQRDQEPAGLQHHLLVQGPLGGVQLPPLLPGKSHGHILISNKHLESQAEAVVLVLGLLMESEPISLHGKDAETKQPLKAELCAGLQEADTALD